MRTRSVAVVIEREELLVIARRKNGREYCVLPGGGVEDGETAREACVRELQEETGLHGVVTAELTPFALPSESTIYFRVTAPHEAPSLGGPEATRSSAPNTYEPRWVPIAELDLINLVPDHARQAVRIQLDRPG
jgi:8-oxo-dGTP diphosphatase